jgi:hypothetical protein
MKLMTLRAGFMVYELMLSAPPASPRSERIVERLASCADDFLGAVLRDFATVDPASAATDAPPPEVRRLARELLAVAVSAMLDEGDPSMYGALATSHASLSGASIHASAHGPVGAPGSLRAVPAGKSQAS